MSVPMSVSWCVHGLHCRRLQCGVPLREWCRPVPPPLLGGVHCSVSLLPPLPPSPPLPCFPTLCHAVSVRNCFSFSFFAPPPPKQCSFRPPLALPLARFSVEKCGSKHCRRCWANEALLCASCGATLPKGPLWSPRAYCVPPIQTSKRAKRWHCCVLPARRAWHVGGGAGGHRRTVENTVGNTVRNTVGNTVVPVVARVWTR